MSGGPCPGGGGLAYVGGGMVAIPSTGNCPYDGGPEVPGGGPVGGACPCV